MGHLLHGVGYRKTFQLDVQSGDWRPSRESIHRVHQVKEEKKFVKLPLSVKKSMMPELRDWS
jgi:hypothetical protein